MTDKDVKKALECCYTNNSDDCYKCPYEGESTAQMFCDKKLTRDALDLINRLQANYDALKDQEEREHQYCKNVCEPNYKAEIESLSKAYSKVFWERDIFAEDMKEEIKKDCSYLALDIKTIKADAIKEFVERLNDKAFHDMNDGEAIVCCCDIDEIYKEMVGEYQ